MRITSWTPSRMPIISLSTLPAPTTPRTVRVAPDDRCTSIPHSINRAMTMSTCASVARSSITTIMTSSPLPVLRAFCIRSFTEGRSRAVAAHAGGPLGPPRFVDDTLENPDDRLGRQGACQLAGRLPDAVEHLRFPLGLEDRQTRFMLEPAHFHRTRHSYIQQTY